MEHEFKELGNVRNIEAATMAHELDIRSSVDFDAVILTSNEQFRRILNVDKI